MAISALTRIGGLVGGTGNLSSGSLTVPAGGVSAGTLIVVRFSSRIVTGSITITDTGGNSYTLDRSLASSRRLDTFSAPVTTPLAAGDTINFSASAPQSHVLVDAYWVAGADLSGSRVVDVQSANGNDASPSVSITPTASGQLVIGSMARSGTASNDSDDTDTTDGIWVSMPELDIGTSFSANNVLNGQYKIITGPAAQTYNPTLSASRTWTTIGVVYREAPPSADEVAVRSGVVSGSRVAILVDRSVAPRSGVVSGTRIAITAQAQAPVTLRSGVEAGSRITISARGPSDAVPTRSGVVSGSRVAVKVDKATALRSGVEAGSRVAITVDRELTARSGVDTGSRISIVAANMTGVVEVRSGVEVGSRIAIKVEVRVHARAGVVIGQRFDIQRWRNLSLRSGVVVGTRDGYVGPGTGIVAFDADPESRRRKAILALQAGDSTRVLIPRGEINGMTGVARVLGRRVTDRDALPSFDVQLTPDDDPGAVVARRSAGQTVRPVEGAQLTRRLRERLGRR